ncbi:hypothetical protein KR054_012324, partial [Drosophila jambulina]
KMPENYNSISIRAMTQDDFPTVDPLVCENFLKDEPLLGSLRITFQPETKAICDAIHLSIIEEGNSLVAFEEKNPEVIVGFVLGLTKTPEHAKMLSELTEKMQPDLASMLNYVNQLEVKANVFENFKVDKILYSYITFVKSDMRGRGVGTRLAQALMEVGRAKGFPLMMACCTSFYSARQKEALGMKCILFQNYADYRDDQGCVVYTPPAPHVAARVLVIEL